MNFIWLFLFGLLLLLLVYCLLLDSKLSKNTDWFKNRYFQRQCDLAFLHQQKHSFRSRELVLLISNASFIQFCAAYLRNIDRWEGSGIGNTQKKRLRKQEQALTNCFCLGEAKNLVVRGHIWQLSSNNQRVKDLDEEKAQAKTRQMHCLVALGQPYCFKRDFCQEQKQKQN